MLCLKFAENTRIVRNAASHSPRKPKFTCLYRIDTAGTTQESGQLLISAVRSCISKLLDTLIRTHPDISNQAGILVVSPYIRPLDCS